MDTWPQRPSVHHQAHLIDGAIEWIDLRPLQQQRADRWEAMKAERELRLAGRFEALGKIFQVDLLTLPGAALDALIAQQAGEVYSQPWVLADNTVQVLTAAELITVARACAAYVKSLWAISVQLRADIEAAADAEAIAAIGWPTNPTN